MHQYSVCESYCVGGKSSDERNNCISKCLSPICFDKYYSAQPLEDGEVDEGRKLKFSNCVTIQFRERNTWKPEENVSEKERHMRDSEWLPKTA